MVCKLVRCRIFCLMVSRNMKSRKKQKLTILGAVLMPMLFSFFITMLEFLPDESVSTQTTLKYIEYKEWWDSLIKEVHKRREIITDEYKTFEHNVFIPTLTIGYAPNTSPGIRKLVEGATRDMSTEPAKIYGCKDCNELRYTATKDHFIASVCFHDVMDKSQRGLPLNLNFSIIMTSELKFYQDSWIGDNWKILDMYDKKQTSVSHYVLEGFISLQYYISYQYLKLASGNAKLPKVMLRSFNLNYSVNAIISESIDASVLVLILGFMFPVTVLTKEIVEDRELVVHFALDRGNAGSRCQFVAWYFNGLWLLFVCCSLTTLALKIEWSGHTTIFEKCPWYIMLFFLTSYAFSVVALCILMGVTMRTSKLVVAVVPVYWVLVSLPLNLGQLLRPSMSDLMVIVVSHLLCNVSMSQGLRRLLSIQHHVVKLNSKQYLKATITVNDPTLLMFIWSFYAQTLLYLLLATFLESKLFTCLVKLMKCMPCRPPLLKLLIWLEKKTRRKRTYKRIAIDLSKKTVRFFRDKIRKIIPANNIEKDSTNDSKSSSSVSGRSGKRYRHQSLFDKQLLVWLNSYQFDFARSMDDESDDSEIVPKYYMQRPTLDGKPIELPKTLENEIKNEAVTGPIVVEFSSVWKKYGKTYAVRDFSLKVHQNEIVVILGHNAAGKKTILNMASGYELPDFGKVYVQGYNVVKHPSRAFKQVGVSLKKVHLYSEFTFSEHLLYLCRLRGLSAQESEDDVDLYISYLQAEDISESAVPTLTSGQRRLLQALCAFAGRKKIVMLDMPFEGIDMEKRQLFYQLAMRERQHRTILITSNSTNVAGKLSNRIALLINGKLFACCKERQLLRLNKSTYRMICFMGINYDMKKLTDFFEIHTNCLELETQMVDTAVFIIDNSDLEGFYKLLDALPANKTQLHLDTYQIITNTLDYILMNVIMHDKDNKSKECVANTMPHLANRIRQIEEIKHVNKKAKFKYDSRRLYALLEIVVKKRFVQDIRDNALPILQVFLPSLLCAWSLSTLSLQQERQALPTVPMTMKCFKNPITILRQKDTKWDGMQAARKHYLDDATPNERIIEIGSNRKITKTIRQHMAENLLLTDLNYVVAASFDNISVEASYNTYLINSAPVSLARVLDALAVWVNYAYSGGHLSRDSKQGQKNVSYYYVICWKQHLSLIVNGFVNPNASIRVELELLPHTTLHSAYLGEDVNRMYALFCVAVCLSFCFVWTMSLLNVGLGLKMQYDRLELIAGMRYGVLSVGNLVYGIIKVISILVSINAIFISFHRSLHMDTYDHFALFYVFLLAALCVMSINILVSLRLTELRMGYIVIIQVYSIGIVLYLSRYEWAIIHLKSFVWILQFAPYYALANSMMQINKLSHISDICNDKQSYETSVYLENCKQTPNCCVSHSSDPFFLHQTWAAYITVSFIWTYMYFKLKSKKPKPIIKVDRSYHDSDQDSCFEKRVLHFNEGKEPDKTVITEKMRLRLLEHAEAATKPLLVENVAVFFLDRVVLNRITFMVDRYQAISVVGVNGAGKTMLFKAMLGSRPQNVGNIISYGKNSYQFKEYGTYKLIGHCAQDDTISDALTVMEYIEILLRIRGLTNPKALLEAQTLLKIFDLYSSRHHLLAHCSRGMLKRLKIAISLIGYATVILMDEPFAYLDVRSRLNIFTIIQARCNQGHIVVYTCSHPKNCESGNRIALIHGSTMRAMGDRFELQMKYLFEYIEVKARVQITDGKKQFMELEKLRVSNSSRSWNSAENHSVHKISSIIEHHFPHAIIRDIINQSACFWLSKNKFTMAVVMDTLHKNNEVFYLFSIIQMPYLKSTFQTIIENPSQTTESPYVDNDDDDE